MVKKLKNSTFWAPSSFEKSDQHKIFFPMMYYMIYFIPEIISTN